MLHWIIFLVSRINAFFKLDVLYQISHRLLQVDRGLLLWKLLTREHVECLTFCCDGTLWTSLTGDTITLELFRQGGYQRQEVHALLSWMKKYGRFEAGKHFILDIGANIGTSSIPFAQKTSCHVFAIEPVPENFNVLCQNIRQNNLYDRITCIQKAISTHPGILSMTMPGHIGSSAAILPPDRQVKLPPSLRKNASLRLRQTL